MNREILFRGKRIDNCEWVYGFYWTNGLGNHFIRVIKKDEDNYSKFIIDDFEVIQETVGQYTGLNDKYGKKIFENDIIVCSWLLGSAWHVVFIEGSYYLRNIYSNRCLSFSEVIERIKGNIQGNIMVINALHKKVEQFIF